MSNNPSPLNDIDAAMDFMRKTRQNVTAQAGKAVDAQANLAPQTVSRLINTSEF